MIRVIEAISEFIDGWTDERSVLLAKNWGFVELSYRESKGKDKTSSQPIPMTINGTGERKQVSLNDNKNFISWIRWTSVAQDNLADEDSWGLKRGKRKTVPLRVVIAHRVELGEVLIHELAADLPDDLIVSGYDYVWINENWSIDPDHETIYRTELGETVYEKHRFTWNLYVLNLNVDFKEC